ncbi:MAG: hypothetical protein ABI868_13580 [Acidobacteriota bacterium]
MRTAPMTEAAGRRGLAIVARSGELVGGYSQRRTSLSVFLLIMCVFRDAIFITGPILVFRMDNSLKSGGIYGSALLFGGMLSFLVTGIVLDRIGWRRVACAAAGVLAIANGILAATALGLVPYQREVDIAILVVVFFCGSAFYLVPDILISHLLREEDRPSAYARSGSLYPAVALMMTSTLLFGLERQLGSRALGLTIGMAGLLAALGIALIVKLPGGGIGQDRPGHTPSHPGIAGVLAGWLSGFRFIAADPVMRLLLIFNICLALALAPHNVFITAILKSAFALDDGGVAVAQFTLASVEVVAAMAFPVVARAYSMRSLALVAVAALVIGNGAAAAVLFRQGSAVEAGLWPLGLYIGAHVAVFVGLTFAGAWIRMVRGQSTPASVLGRTVGAMSTASQLFGLIFSLVVSFVGAAIDTHVYYLFCVAITALVGAPMAVAVAKQLALQPMKGPDRVYPVPALQHPAAVVRRPSRNIAGADRPQDHRASRRDGRRPAPGIDTV